MVCSSCGTELVDVVFTCPKCSRSAKIIQRRFSRYSAKKLRDITQCSIKNGTRWVQWGKTERDICLFVKKSQDQYNDIVKACEFGTTSNPRSIEHQNYRKIICDIPAVETVGKRDGDVLFIIKTLFPNLDLYGKFEQDKGCDFVFTYNPEIGLIKLSRAFSSMSSIYNLNTATFILNMIQQYFGYLRHSQIKLNVVYQTQLGGVFWNNFVTKNNFEFSEADDYSIKLGTKTVNNLITEEVNNFSFAFSLFSKITGEVSKVFAEKVDVELIENEDQSFDLLVEKK